jgi:hypothetical protein
MNRPAEPTVRSSPPPVWLAAVVLVGLLGAHFWVATVRWHSPALIDHEFRQSQTAVIARYIDLQNNFSINYETPIMGEPWEIPLEFPFYQWVVVAGARILDLPHVPVARGVSLASFYLTLVALWILLRAVGLKRAQRCWVLAFVLPIPAYLFYSRAFLIDPFATMASAWFLAAFQRTLATRKLRWATVAMTAGIVAALVKSVVFFVWLLPAAVYGAFVLGRSMVRREGWRPVADILRWGVLPVVPSLLSLKWWIYHTDKIKAAHPSGYIFTSENLSVGNFGSFTWESRLDLQTWATLFERWREALIGPAWVGAALLLGLIGTRKYRVHALVCIAAFFVGQLAFPYAYAFQDYYFYAGAAFLGLALGFLALGWLEASRLPRALSWVIALAPLALMAQSYHAFYYQNLMVDDDRDWVVTRIFRELLPEDAVIVVAGGDWSAVPAYQSHRRTLMIRNGLEHDGAYLVQAFNDLQDNTVGAMMFIGETRDNERLRKFAIEQLGLDPRPTFAAADCDIYIARGSRDEVIASIQANPRSYEGLGATDFAEREPPAPPEQIQLLSTAESREKLPLFDGLVEQYRSPHSLYSGHEYNRTIVGLHPPLELWLRPPQPSGKASWEVGLNPLSYQDKEAWEGTDGVGFFIYRESASGERERLAWRFLNPIEEPSDRGLVRLETEFDLEAGEFLVLQSVAGFNDAFDWAYMTEFELSPPGE